MNFAKKLLLLSWTPLMVNILGIVTFLFVAHEQISGSSNFAKSILIGSIFVSGLCSIVGSGIISKDLRRRLKSIEENYSKFVQKEPLNEALIGDDEIAKLDKAFRSIVASSRT